MGGTRERGKGKKDLAEKKREMRGGREERREGKKTGNERRSGEKAVGGGKHSSGAASGTCIFTLRVTFVAWEDSGLPFQELSLFSCASLV